MLSLFLNQKLHFSRSRLSFVRVVLILVVSTVGISDCAVAGVLNKYCLSRTGQTEPIKESEKTIPQEPIPPFIGSVDNLPELYEKSCSRIAYFFDMCTRNTFFDYSPTLDRAFFQGYPLTKWGGGFVHLEISEEGTKSVPDELVNSGFIEDVPTLNGALFISNLDEALFYDGNKVTNFSQYFPKPERRKTNQLRGWHYTETSENRFFIVNVGISSEDRPFVMEVKSGFHFTFISIPEELNNTWLSLFTLSGDSRLWGIARKGILREINEKLQYVVHISSPLFIDGTARIRQLADGSVMFPIKNKADDSTTDYFLKKASPTANCEIMLDEEQPVLLDPELNN